LTLSEGKGNAKSKLSGRAPVNRFGGRSRGRGGSLGGKTPKLSGENPEYVLPNSMGGEKKSKKKKEKMGKGLGHIRAKTPNSAGCYRVSGVTC